MSDVNEKVIRGIRPYTIWGENEKIKIQERQLKDQSKVTTTMKGNWQRLLKVVGSASGDGPKVAVGRQGRQSKRTATSKAGREGKPVRMIWYPCSLFLTISDLD